jgi:hypothetical protein
MPKPPFGSRLTLSDRFYTRTVSAWITTGRDEAPIARGVWLEATHAKKSPAEAGLRIKGSNSATTATCQLGAALV